MRTRPSPEYIKEHPLINDTLESLLDYDLLDYERIEPNWINWSIWFKALGLKSLNLKASGFSNNYITLIDAATRGQGVTLGTRYLLDQELESGRLARVSTYSMKSGRNYFLMTNNEHYYRKEIVLMHEWISSYCKN